MTPSSGMHEAAVPRRSKNPRRSRLQLEMSTAAARGLVLAGIGACALVFGAGYQVGAMNASHEKGAAQSEQAAQETQVPEGSTAAVSATAARPEELPKPLKAEAPVALATARTASSGAEPAAGSNEATPAAEVVRLPGEVDREEANLKAPKKRETAIRVRRKLPSSGFGVQIRAFTSKKDVNRFVQENSEALDGHRVFMARTRISGKGTWYRVRMGRFENAEDAERAKDALPEALREGSLVIQYQ